MKIYSVSNYRQIIKFIDRLRLEKMLLCGTDLLNVSMISYAINIKIPRNVYENSDGKIKRRTTIVAKTTSRIFSINLISVTEDFRLAQ